MAKTLEEQTACRCVHFTGLQNESCKAGVAYESVKDEAAKGFGRWPCWRDGESVPCEKRHYPTPEEVAADLAELEILMNRTTTAMCAVRVDANSHGFKKGNGGVGKIKCPVCESGELHYSVAGYNGHCHGRCSTDGCVGWMQ